MGGTVDFNSSALFDLKEGGIMKKDQWESMSDSHFVDDIVNEDDEEIISKLLERLESVDLNNCISHEEVYRELGITVEDLEGFEDIEFGDD